MYICSKNQSSGQNFAKVIFLDGRHFSNPRACQKLARSRPGQHAAVKCVVATDISSLQSQNDATRKEIADLAVDPHANLAALQDRLGSRIAFGTAGALRMDLTLPRRQFAHVQDCVRPWERGFHA